MHAVVGHICQFNPLLISLVILPTFVLAAQHQHCPAGLQHSQDLFPVIDQIRPEVMALDSSDKIKHIIWEWQRGYRTLSDFEATRVINLLFFFMDILTLSSE
jgi:hypothetical protein